MVDRIMVDRIIDEQQMDVWRAKMRSVLHRTPHLAHLLGRRCQMGDEIVINPRAVRGAYAPGIIVIPAWACATEGGLRRAILQVVTSPTPSA